MSGCHRKIAAVLWRNNEQLLELKTSKLSKKLIRVLLLRDVLVICKYLGSVNLLNNESFTSACLLLQCDCAVL